MAEFSGNASAGVDQARRNFLTKATVVTGAVGAAFAAVPFVESWLPSERARARGGPVDLDTSKIEAGQMIIVTWRMKPIYVVRRSSAMLSKLENHDADLKDPGSERSEQPRYARNAPRSRRKDLFVAIGVCTHLGCLPKARFEPGLGGLGAQWPGGFFCPCHGSRFDLAGRVFNGSPASVNLVIPPYRFADQLLVIGTDDGTAAV